MYDLIIIGGGPGGVAAGVYASRKKLKTLVIADSFGGQSLTSAEIQNWIGTKAISGIELAKALEDHLRSQEGIEILDNDLVVKVEKARDYFKVETKNGKSFEAKTLLVVTGCRRRKLGVPGEKELDGRGVAYCATCDAPLFSGKTVAVVGGGNAGLESVRDLLGYALKIFLLEFMDSLKGDPTTQDRILSNPKVEVILNAKIIEILGDKFVVGLRYEDQRSKETKELALQGVFVEIGSIPNSDFMKDLVELNKAGEIVVDPRNGRASLTGIWAAGDVSDGIFKQNNISVGDAIKAVLDIYDYLNKK